MWSFLQSNVEPSTSTIQGRLQEFMVGGVKGLHWCILRTCKWAGFSGQFQCVYTFEIGGGHAPPNIFIGGAIAPPAPPPFGAAPAIAAQFYLYLDSYSTDCPLISCCYLQQLKMFLHGKWGCMILLCVWVILALFPGAFSRTVCACSRFSQNSVKP